MASGMGTGPGPGQGSWPSQPQAGGGRQYPASSPSYPDNPLGQSAAGHYASGGRFPVAEPFDGVNPDGTPRIVRAQLDPREVPHLTMYLTQAPVVLAAPGNAQDELVPSAGQVIPRAFHSDGVWVWPAAVGYYLGCYQLPPSDALLAHIRMRNYQLGFVSQETRSAAASELMAVLNAPATPAAPPPPANPFGSQPQYPQAGQGQQGQGQQGQGQQVQGPSGQSALASYSAAGVVAAGPVGTGPSTAGPAPTPNAFGQQPSASPQLPPLPAPAGGSSSAPAPVPATILTPLSESGGGPDSSSVPDAEPTIGMTPEELAAELAASQAVKPGVVEPESVSSESAATSLSGSPAAQEAKSAQESETSAASESSAPAFDPSASQTALYVFSPDRATSSRPTASEPRTEPRTESEPESKGEAEPESKAESKAEAESGTQTEAEAEDKKAEAELLGASSDAADSAETSAAAADPAAVPEPGPAASGTVNPAGPTMVFSAAEAMAQWASLDASLPQAGPPLAPTLFSPELSALGNKHAAWVSEQLEAFTAFMPTGDWSVDHDTRRYTQSERSLLVDGLGTLSPDGIWTWAWSEFGGWDQESGILDQSRVLRSLAEREDVAELISASVDLTGLGDAEDPATAAEMLAWAATGMLGARGYIGHSSSTGGRIYYLVTDAAVPQAKPTLALIARALFEGTAAFGESATDCVIGYAEHHGWEWNRTPNGIGVAATGLGSFAVEIIDDRLVGLTLHV